MNKPRVLKVFKSLADWDGIIYTLEGEMIPTMYYWLLDGSLPDALAGIARFHIEWNDNEYSEYKKSRGGVDQGRAEYAGYKSLEHMRNELLGGE